MTSTRAWLEVRIAELLRDEYGLDLARGRADRALANHLERVLPGASSPAGDRAFFDQLLDARSPERARLVHAVTVRHSWFFRDVEQLTDIARFMVTRHAATRRTLAVWVAGCASGEEAWTLALLAHEHGVPLELVASDIDRMALDEAEQGEFDEFRLRELPPASLAHFTALAEGRWRIRPDTLPRCRVEFRQHNLCGPLPERSFDLISCRNVLIYLVPEQARTVAARLRTRLVPGGVLELGGIDRLSELALRYAAGEDRAKRDEGADARPPAGGTATRASARGSSRPDTPAPTCAAGPARAPGDELLLAARDAIARDDPESALGLLGTSLEHDEHAELLLWRGLAWHRSGRQREAITALRHARRLQPNLWPAGLFAALAHERAGDDAEALRCWQALRRELDGPTLVDPRGSPALLESLPEWRSEARALARQRTKPRRSSPP